MDFSVIIFYFYRVWCLAMGCLNWCSSISAVLTNVFVFIIAAAATPKGRYSVWEESTAGTVLGFNHITVQLQDGQRTLAHEEMCVGRSGCTPKNREANWQHTDWMVVFTLLRHRETISAEMVISCESPKRQQRAQNASDAHPWILIFIEQNKKAQKNKVPCLFFFLVLWSALYSQLSIDAFKTKQKETAKKSSIGTVQ